jgi:hypothetical protein
MQPGQTGLFGAGIHFTDAEWSAGHKCAHNDPRGQGYNVVLWFNVNLGRALVLEGTQWKHMNLSLLAAKSCHSVMGRSHSEAQWEYVVFDSSQVTFASTDRR